MKTQSLTKKLLSTLAVTSLLLASAGAVRAGDVTTPGDPVVPTSINSPDAERSPNAIDNNPATKYLNFDKLNTGFTVTPSRGSSVVKGLALVSANDAPERDPASFTLEGSNDGGANWTMIASGPIPAFTARFQERVVSFPNTAAFTSYRLLFPTVANAGSANSMQIAEVQFLNSTLNRSIGAHFIGRNINSTIDPSELAGVGGFAQRNWNGVNQGDPAVGTSAALRDRDGNLTPVTLQYDANDSWNNDGPSGTANERLMGGVIKAAGAGHVDTFTLHNVAPGRYDLVLYADVNLNSSLFPTNVVAVDFTAGATTYYINEMHRFEFYKQAFNTTDPASGGSRDTGNFVVFDALTPDASGNLVFTMKYIGTQGDGSGLAAVQLLSHEPKVFDAVGANLTHMRVTFTKPVTDGAGETDNYRLSGGLTISSAVLDASHTTVTLTTSPQTAGSTYTLTINNVASRDAFADQISPDTQVNIKAASPFDVAINFSGGNPGQPDVPWRLAPNEVAGVFPTAGWNNIDGNIGDTTMLDYYPLTHTDGSATPVTISFSADEEWSSFADTSTPDGKLFRGYFGFANGDGVATSNIRPVALHGVPEGHYTVVVYTLRDGSGEPETITINNDADSTLHVKSESGGDWNANKAFRRGTSISLATAQLCNYVQFDNVQPVAGTITVDARSEFFRSPVNGMQLVLTDVIPISFVTQPVDTVAPPSAPFSFSVTVIGSGPRTIQWKTNGVAIAGANSLTYSGTAASYMDLLNFTVDVGNSAGTVTSSPGVLHVAPVPFLVSASSLESLNSVCVRFTKPMGASALDKTHYSISGGITINSAAFAPSDSSVVVLSTSTLTSGTTYTVTVTGVTDADVPPNTIFPNPSSTTFKAGGYFANVRIVVQRYENIGGAQAVSQLTSSAKFPNNPDFRSFDPPMFENPQTSPNLEGFGAQMLGVYVAPVSGLFQFAIATDDNSRLYLSTDENPANKVLIAGVPDWADVHEYMKFPADQVSSQIELIAGNHYYMEALYKEGGGGDHCEVAVRVPGDPEFTVSDRRNGIPISQFALQSFSGASDSFYTPGPVVITSQSPDQYAVDGKTATFTVDFTGTPPTIIKWIKNGVVILGATGKSITVPATLADNGAVFSAVVQNACSTASSTNVTLNVVADTFGPTVVDAGCDAVDRGIRVVFSEAVVGGAGDNAADNPLNYSLDQGLGIASALLLSDNKTVLLTATDVLTPLTLYTLHIQNVADTAGATAMDPVDVPITGCVCTNGTLKRETWTGIGGTAVGDLTNHQRFLANAPNTTDYLLTEFNTGGDKADNYGIRVQGYIIPTDTANYSFRLTSDDASVIFLSTDSSPANKRVLIKDDACCNDRFTASPTHLEAGHAYYVDAYMKEGGGGDYLRLAWSTPANPTYVFIPGANLRYCYDPQKILFSATIPDVTVTECRPATFRATVVADNKGSILYQWYKDDVLISGATASTYTLPSASLDTDNGSVFRLHMTHTILLQEKDVSATLTVEPDLVEPVLLSAVGDASLHKVTLSFSEAIDPATATDSTAYTVCDDSQTCLAIENNTLTIVNGTNVVITLIDAQTPGAHYTVTVQSGNLYDLCFRNFVSQGSTVSFHAWTYVSCLLTFETFNTDGGVGITSLTGSPNYPNNPRERAFIKGFDSRQVYGNDSHDMYGGRMWGYLTPPSSGNFVFYLRSDDAGQLRLNSNADPALSTDPAGAVVVADEPGCCHGFSFAHSGSIHLNGGQRYYVEGIWAEGIGGDYLQIAVAAPGLTDAQADALSPMGPEFLGTIGNPDLYPTLQNFRVTFTTGGGNLILSWGGPGPCGPGVYRLQGTDELANPSSATVWTDIAGPSPMSVPTSSPHKFFRLISP